MTRVPAILSVNLERPQPPAIPTILAAGLEGEDEAVGVVDGDLSLDVATADSAAAGFLETASASSACRVIKASISPAIMNGITGNRC